MIQQKIVSVKTPERVLSRGVGSRKLSSSSSGSDSSVGMKAEAAAFKPVPLRSGPVVGVHGVGEVSRIRIDLEPGAISTFDQLDAAKKAIAKTIGYDAGRNKLKVDEEAVKNLIERLEVSQAGLIKGLKSLRSKGVSEAVVCQHNSDVFLYNIAILWGLLLLCQDPAEHAGVTKSDPYRALFDPAAGAAGAVVDRLKVTMGGIVYSEDEKKDSGAREKVRVLVNSLSCLQNVIQTNYSEVHLTGVTKSTNTIMANWMIFLMQSEPNPYLRLHSLSAMSSYLDAIDERRLVQGKPITLMEKYLHKAKLALETLDLKLIGQPKETANTQAKILLREVDELIRLFCQLRDADCTDWGKRYGTTVNELNAWRAMYERKYSEAPSFTEAEVNGGYREYLLGIMNEADGLEEEAQYLDLQSRIAKVEFDRLVKRFEETKASHSRDTEVLVKKVRGLAIANVDIKPEKWHEVLDSRDAAKGVSLMSGGLEDSAAQRAMAELNGAHDTRKEEMTGLFGLINQKGKEIIDFKLKRDAKRAKKEEISKDPSLRRVPAWLQDEAHPETLSRIDKYASISGNTLILGHLEKWLYVNKVSGNLVANSGIPDSLLTSPFYFYKPGGESLLTFVTPEQQAKEIEERSARIAERAAQQAEEKAKLLSGLSPEELAAYEQQQKVRLDIEAIVEGCINKLCDKYGEGAYLDADTELDSVMRSIIREKGGITDGELDSIAVKYIPGAASLAPIISPRPVIVFDSSDSKIDIAFLSSRKERSDSHVSATSSISSRTTASTEAKLDA